ncbi:hypothetical protein ASPZODRAFT_162157 [Penicilliopsis zonata CBS 506.65]|uniref:LysM domain-containing protein n=1 Tax=Penicilliopsis zonata CBS 506.65 TaxID=1073090 RepID=A0A1L9S5V8_9EURO|nr:hypothetical protein ASPZODRAFT_162157 [Penicilliopsis zonata CBS 506.65]OJJ42541.1 hypothetical protein ASPZODRAFT_162157 [Penicilliopsis zonata CBS 506.65]
MSFCVYPCGPTLPGIASNCVEFYTVVSGDYCEAVEKRFGITAADFLAWNPSISTDCLTNFWAGYAYCVGINSAATTSTSISTTSTSTISTTIDTTSPTVTSSITTTPYSIRHSVTPYNLTAPVTATAYPPTNTLGGEPRYCNFWHWIGASDTCERIVNQYSNRLSLDQLHEWNPTLGDDCSGLYYNWYVCVGVQPQTGISFYWSTSATNANVPSPTLYTPTITTIIANFTASPQQLGIPSSCQNFYQAQAGDTCSIVLDRYSYITQDQFFDWNPALGNNCQGLLEGYYYCVASFDSSNLPLPPTITASASPTATDTVAQCNSWYKTVINDDCATIALIFGTLSEADFISWNPSVGSRCQRIQQGTYYCVGVPGTATTRTSPLPTTTTGPGSMPTQSGIASNCTRFWLVSSSDTCSSIISKSGVSSIDFYNWNPAAGNECTGLTPDYYVCVSTTISTSTSESYTTITGAVSTTSKPPTATTSGSAVTTPSPIMPGMVDGCVRFWYRGDDSADLYCQDIATDAGISLSDFYSWNPGVGKSCTSLWQKSWYCIGISGPRGTISTGPPTPICSSA